MTDATRLTRQGKLAEATRLIQRALQGLRAPKPATEQAEPRAANPAAPMAHVLPEVEDVAFRELPAQPDIARPEPEPAPADTVHRPGAFDSHVFISGGKSYNYRLFTPDAAAGTAQGPRPVLVLLHGCKQDAADFAAGTAMNVLAQEQQCIVVYPEQLRSANQMGCWNWFEPAHQRRGSGEPEMIASLARQVVEQHGGDAGRVYVAGLSAGGAMATIVAQLYPDVFAAVGVHSGLGPGSANDVVSAFAAMRKAQRKTGAPRQAAAALPTIVFHGSADKTVHPSNGSQIVQETVAALKSGGELKRVLTKSTEGDRAAMRTSYSRDDGTVMLEYWEVAAGPHAWSGGDAAGSYTDPSGPSASAAMLRFFLRHRRPAS
ncbi:PHB depolymerase family esterase [Caenimonas sedimenti]|uniref:PHB depolymerase family esterase n=2 Tax=Caenimonas sedimenti TaxID=2596921 RepID=A0A562ZQR4_9BURK|nr:PHB depolymerase family esterase [Caenimonas sedimenti]